MTLRNGKHTVTVSTATTVQGNRGQLVQQWSEGQTFQVNVQPLSSTEREAIGLAVETVYRIKYFPQQHGGKPWPGGAYTRITWNGREYDQLGEATISSMSERTGHTKILMRARSSEVK